MARALRVEKPRWLAVVVVVVLLVTLAAAVVVDVTWVPARGADAKAVGTDLVTTSVFCFVKKKLEIEAKDFFIFIFFVLTRSGVASRQKPRQT